MEDPELAQCEPAKGSRPVSRGAGSQGGRCRSPSTPHKRANMSRLPQLHVSNQKAFVWNVAGPSAPPCAERALRLTLCLLAWADIQTLRTEHHICGILSGTLPQVSQQNTFLGLPLVLLPEEVVLLVKNSPLPSPLPRDAPQLTHPPRDVQTSPRSSTTRARTCRRRAPRRTATIARARAPSQHSSARPSRSSSPSASSPRTSLRPRLTPAPPSAPPPPSRSSSRTCPRTAHARRVRPGACRAKARAGRWTRRRWRT